MRISAMFSCRKPHFAKRAEIPLLGKLIVILGPTASGKTDFAVKLAKKFNGEIISADSRQIYKEMDIGPAKPSKKEKRLVPHHLIDLIKPNQRFNVAVYKKLALKAIKDVENRNKMPFLVGGTGLYIKSIVDNINFPAVPAQKKLRKKMEKKTKKELFKIYKKLDPEGAKFIDKNNKRRLIRAIEVCKVTKKPFWKQREKGKTLFNTLIIGIKLPEKELEKIVKIRIEKMFRLGLEKEVKKLIKRYGWRISPLQTIGYQEWHDYFNKKRGKNEVKKQIISHTLQFSKRQMTWFKKDKRINWIKNYKSAEKLVKKII
jgi:tRNA dimethylallyltransferase